MNHQPLQTGLLPGFVLLSLAKLFERFGFYAIRSILFLYLIDQGNALNIGDEEQLLLNSMFTLLILALPFVGAILADFVLGTSRTLLLGAMLAFAGYVTMALGSNIYLSLTLISLGTGCYTPSHWGLTGQLFKAHKSRLDGAVTLTFVLINIAAMLAGIGISTLVIENNWLGAFVLIAIFQLISCLFIIFGRKYFPADSKIKSSASTAEQHSFGDDGLVPFTLVIIVIFAIAGTPETNGIATSGSIYFWSTLSGAMAIFSALVLGVWWWFKAVLPAIKLTVALLILVLALIVGDPLLMPTHDLYIWYGAAYLLAVGLFDALFTPIIISITLQRGNPRYLATSVVFVTVLIAVTGNLFNHIKSLM